MTCKHEWEIATTAIRESNFSNMFYGKVILFCKNCAEVKKIEI